MLVHKKEIVISSQKAELNYWKDLWQFRELFYFLSLRDIKVRYKQTVLGAAWSIIRPLFTTIVFTIVFSKFAKVPASGIVPYSLMVYVGMLPWQYFSSALSEASGSLIGNANLISKVYFPRMIIPASSVITSFVDFAISFIILILMFVWHRFLPPIQILILPVFILITFLCSLGVGLYLTALNVKYRDFRYIVPFIVQFGLYITPVGFSSNLVDTKYRFWLGMNPMKGVIDGFRWCLLDEPLLPASIIQSIVITLFFLWLGVTYFRKMEKTFADNI